MPHYSFLLNITDSDRLSLKCLFSTGLANSWCSLARNFKIIQRAIVTVGCYYEFIEFVLLYLFDFDSCRLLTLTFIFIYLYWFCTTQRTNQRVKMLRRTNSNTAGAELLLGFWRWRTAINPSKHCVVIQVTEFIDAVTGFILLIGNKIVSVYA